MENSAFIGAAEGAEYIEAAFQEFYLLMVGQFDNLCIKPNPYPLTFSAGTRYYGLPTDVLKVKMVELQDGADSTYHLLRPLSSIVEMVPFRIGNRRGMPTHYWLQGLPEGGPDPQPGPMQLMPLLVPDQTYTAQVWYVPNISLADMDGTFGMAHVAGWNEYVVLTAAMKMKDKEESDCTVLMAERATLWDNMKRMLTPMDESEPGHVVMMGSVRGRAAFTADPFDSGDFG